MHTTENKNCIIVASRKDPASINITQALIGRFGFQMTDERFEEEPIYSKNSIMLICLKRDAILAEHLDEKFSPDFYVFVSRHTSSKGIPSLTAHFPGNFSEDNSRGGRPKELAHTYPSLLKAYFKNLWQRRNKAKGYRIALEATHHGPTSLRKPVLYVEIGSSEREWKDQEAALLVSDALMDTVTDPIPDCKVGIGFGGPHYSEKFAELILGSEYGLGAIASKYALEHLELSVLRQMIEKCVEKVNHAFLDWKGLGAQKAALLKILEESGLKVVRV
ncbi:MAG: hypothetical protein HY619_04230 [Thaumarchaeota archaeon]|nr:hypothetical protein [Nitrososphaerota archaeon]